MVKGNLKGLAFHLDGIAILLLFSYFHASHMAWVQTFGTFSPVPCTQAQVVHCLSSAHYCKDHFHVFIRSSNM